MRKTRLGLWRIKYSLNMVDTYWQKKELPCLSVAILNATQDGCDINFESLR